MRERTGKRAAPAATNGNGMEHAGNGQQPSLAAMQRDNLDAIIRSNMALLDGAVALSSEMLDFTQEQIQQALQLPCGIGADPASAFTAQVEHLQAMTEHCVGRAARLMSLSARVSRDSAAPLADRLAATLGRFPASQARDGRAR
ncbi:MAG TPA: phasin family protein [Dongiaceae bacterium]|jgi:hypothetical protein|nr:phasin family protein [Dongiaceae bacterium]